jgi:hypothetical protein
LSDSSTVLNGVRTKYLQWLTGAEAEGTLRGRFMARKLRLQYPGAIYHVMNRGDRRESIYEDDEDRSLFLETLGEACQKTDWAGSCLVFDERSFSSGDRNSAAQPCERDAMAAGRLYQSIQSPPQGIRPPLQWALQGAAGRGQRQRVSQERLRLRASQPGAGQLDFARST